MKWTMQCSSTEIQFPPKQVLSEQPRVLVGLVCHLSVLITHHHHVDPAPTGGTDVLLLTSSNPKILIYFVSKNLIFLIHCHVDFLEFHQASFTPP